MFATVFTIGVLQALKFFSGKITSQNLAKGAAAVATAAAKAAAKGR